MIAERRVLLRVQNFHQRRGRIAAEVASQLVDFVQHHDRIVALGTLQALNNLARQSADVGATMSADFRFVVHTAQCDAHELASQRTCDRFAKRCFANARRSDEAKDWPLHAWLQFLDGQVIQDAFLYLLQVVVIFVQNLVRLGDIDFRAAGRFAPGQRSHPFEIGARNHVFRGSRSHLRQAFQLAFALLLRFGSHARVVDLLAQFLDFRLGVVDFAQFLLNRLHLFAQQIFALVLAYLFLNLLVDLAAELQDLKFLGQFAD